ncbi:MAG: dipicolinate synthase [Oscillospiraceae bacterium]|jgi:dipicolinate synthase subunit A|nr:dipicolinate synthase [Oscillospiraceae bacterium]
MKNDFSFAIAGTAQSDGDTRYIELAKLLPRLTSDITLADAVVFPIPFKWNDELMSALRPEQYILAGNVTAAQNAEAERLGLTLLDYSSGEPFAVANALLTAEGAIETALRETAFTLCNSRSLVIGFGRIGKLLAHRLRGMGSDVAVYARSATDKAWVSAYGYRESDYRSAPVELSRYDVIFNTAPARMLDSSALALARSATIIDLASKPGGVDMKTAERFGIRVIHALGLPGKTAPISAAMIIRDSIFSILGAPSQLQGDPVI